MRDCGHDHPDDLILRIEISAKVFRPGEHNTAASLCIGAVGEQMGPVNSIGVLHAAILVLCEEQGIPYEEVVAALPLDIVQRIVSPAIVRWKSGQN